MLNLIQNKNGYYYLVYKITNKINGHFYIGVHATTEPFDRYMGSGYALKYAKRKYGKILAQISAKSLDNRRL